MSCLGFRHRNLTEPYTKSPPISSAKPWSVRAIYYTKLCKVSPCICAVPPIFMQSLQCPSYLCKVMLNPAPYLCKIMHSLALYLCSYALSLSYLCKVMHSPPYICAVICSVPFIFMQNYAILPILMNSYTVSPRIFRQIYAVFPSAYGKLFSVLPPYLCTVIQCPSVCCTKLCKGTLPHIYVHLCSVVCMLQKVFSPYIFAKLYKIPPYIYPKLWKGKYF